MSMPAFLSPAQKSQFQADAETRRDNWLGAINALFDEVKQWVAEKTDWDLEQSTTDVTEEALGGTYVAPTLIISSPRGRVMLEPIARAVLGADGRIDLYAWPTLARVMLLRQAEIGWVIRTDSGIDWPLPWNKQTFLDLAGRLMDAS